MAVVAVLVVAGGSAAILMNNNSNKDDTSDIGAALPVYGNADLDMDIDEDDLDIIEKIIDSEYGYTLIAYPFADANNDGTVDDSDKTVVQNIIDGKETTVYHYNYYNNGAVNVTVKTVDSKWPCDDIMVTYNSCMFMLTSLGADEKVVGATSVDSVYLDKYMYANIMKNAEALKSTYDSGIGKSLLDVSSVTSVMTNHPDAHSVFCSGYGDYDVYNEDSIEELGCDVIRVCESNPTRDETLASVLLAGFMTGTLDRAKDLVDMYANIWDECTEIYKNLPDSEKKGFLNSLNGTPLNGNANQHNYKCVLAGGKSVLKDSDGNPAMGTWMLEDEYNKNTDVIILIMWSNINNGYFFGDHELNVDYMLQTVKGGDEETVYEMMDAWENGEVYVVYGDFPTAFDILARGYAMYPEEYGDLYEESVDKLLSYIAGGEFADKDLQFVYKLSELENY